MEGGIRLASKKPQTKSIQVHEKRNINGVFNEKTEGENDVSGAWAGREKMFESIAEGA